MPAPNICLFFSNTGGGHRSATEAVAEGIRCLGNDQFNIISDNVVEKSHFSNRAMVDFYNFLLRYDQSCMKYYYGLIQLFKPNESRLCSGFLQKYLQTILAKQQPAVVVSLHPMINQSVARALQHCGLAGKTRFIIVVTDPNDSLWRGWACPEADLIIVPNEAAAGQLLAWGVPQEKMQVIGMPVHPAFIKPPSCDRREFLAQFDLDPEIFTVCLNAGWAGGGNLTAIYQALHKVERKLQVIFLCGYHSKFYSKMSRWAPYGKIPTRVFPFHDNMSDLMNAVDLMVTKAGGLTTFEALARRLPLAIDVITEPMPQEAGTIEILLEAAKRMAPAVGARLAEPVLAQVVKKPDDIIAIVENMPLQTERKNFDLPDFQNLNRVDAVYDIARVVLNQVDPSITMQSALNT